jgi:hypothetical protein
MSSKKIYRPQNWSHYNRSLVQRGDLSLWVCEDFLKKWMNDEKSGKKGAPKTYSDMAILCANQVRLLYHLPLRATQGFLQSLFRMLKTNARVPCYSTICRRLKTLTVPIPISRPKEARVIVLDSTGLKVYGEGEWKTRQHGVSKRRTWRKIHLGFDADSQEVVCAAVTTNDFNDSELLEGCLSQLSPKEIKRVCLDGGYDVKNCYNYCIKNKIQPLIPPRKGAKIWHRRQIQNPHPRDKALRFIRKHGRRKWRLNSGYSQRSLAETGMFRLKQTFSGRRFQKLKTVLGVISRKSATSEAVKAL